MSRPHLSIELAGCGSLVRGYGSRELVEEVAGRAPVWMSRLRGWSIQERTARNLVALAETRGYDITVTSRDLAVRAPQGLEVDHPDIDDTINDGHANHEQGLW